MTKELEHHQVRLGLPPYHFFSPNPVHPGVCGKNADFCVSLLARVRASIMLVTFFCALFSLTDTS